MNKSKNLKTAIGLIGLFGFFASVPLMSHYRNQSLNHNFISNTRKNSGNEIQRGTFLNSGSKDIGPDENWKNGRYNPKNKKK